jgi:protein TonB
VNESKPAATKRRDERQTPKATAPAPMPSTAPTNAPPPAGEHGRVLQQVEPAVSRSARSTISGTIRIRVRAEVDAAGNVERTTFITEGPSKYFARQAMQAAQQWKFAPAQANGQAVPSAWILHFGFKRSGIEINSEPVKR